jgi:hypothetical protein
MSNMHQSRLAVNTSGSSSSSSNPPPNSPPNSPDIDDLYKNMVDALKKMSKCLEKSNKNEKTTAKRNKNVSQSNRPGNAPTQTNTAMTTRPSKIIARPVHVQAKPASALLSFQTINNPAGQPPAHVFLCEMCRSRMKVDFTKENNQCFRCANFYKVCRNKDKPDILELQIDLCDKLREESDRKFQSILQESFVTEVMTKFLGNRPFDEAFTMPSPYLIAEELKESKSRDRQITKSEDVELEFITLDPFDDELLYSSVLKHFQKTALSRYFDVIKIEYVFSPSKYDTYSAKKKSYDKESVLMGKPETETLYLFHGTAEQNIESIAYHGVNPRFFVRSYYGLGANFARTALYSAHPSYSKPNALEYQHMFMCRVLVGDVEWGKPRTKHTTEIPGTKFFYHKTSTDSKVNPNVFVTYDIDQCYPEFLIKFKKKSTAVWAK